MYWVGNPEKFDVYYSTNRCSGSKNPTIVRFDFENSFTGHIYARSGWLSRNSSLQLSEAFFKIKLNVYLDIFIQKICFLDNENHSWPWPVRRTVTYAYVLGRRRTPDVLNLRTHIPKKCHLK